MSLLNPKNLARAAILVVWLIAELIWIYKEIPTPSTDVFLFRDAGVNLATKGEFTVANLPHMEADVSRVFAYYPPLYPFLYGMWSRLTSVSLKSAIVFDSLIRVLRSLLLLALVLVSVPRDRRGERMSFWLAFAAGLSFFTNDGDRPDDLAIVFGLLSWLTARSNQLLGTLGSGVFLGLCGATSPTAGVLFALGAALRALARREFKPVLSCAFLAAVVFAACVAPIYWVDAQAYARFSKQLPLSTFPYLVALHEGRGWAGVITDAVVYLAVWWAAASRITAVLLTLGFLWVGMVALQWDKVSRETKPYLVGSGIFVVLCVLVWTLQPYYLWFAAIPLLLATLLEEAKAGNRVKWIFRGALFVAFVPLMVFNAKLAVMALSRPPAEEASAIRAQILHHVGDESLAVTSDQYFTFRPYKEVANVRYVCDRLENYAYVYSSRYRSARAAENDPYFFPCEPKRECFTVKKIFSTETPLTLFGVATPFIVRGNGGALFENTRCNSPQNQLARLTLGR